MTHRPHAIPSLLLAAFLLLATQEMPYGYYTFVRLVVCGVSIYVAYCGYSWGKTWAMWLFGLVAVLFNPLIPVYLSKAIWTPIDLLVSVAFILGAAFLRRPNGQSSASRN